MYVKEKENLYKNNYSKGLAKVPKICYNRCMKDREGASL